MPRYFFDLRMEENALSDQEGQEFPDADAVWEAAREIARDLMKSTPQTVNWATCSFEVRDEAGEIVLEFPFLEAVEFASKPS
jgi:hypothetical protein